MIERGNTKHDPEQDQQLKHEAQGIVQGQGGPGHIEEWRQTEPLPDDTDSAEVQDAMGLTGALTGDVTDSAADPSIASSDQTDTLTDGAAGPTADPVVHSTETSADAETDAEGGAQ